VGNYILRVNDVLNGLEVTTWRADALWVTEVIDATENIRIHRQTYASEDEAKRGHAAVIEDIRAGRLQMTPLL